MKISPLYFRIDINPKKTIVSWVNRKSIKDPRSFKEFVLAISKQTDCVIRVIGLEKEEENIWISIQSESMQSRQNAFLIINTATGNSCKVFDLPKADTHGANGTNDTKLISSGEDEEEDERVEKNSHSTTSQRSSMVRSSTMDNFASSKPTFNSMSTTNDTKSSPFSSVLSKFKMATIKDDDSNTEPFTTPKCISPNQEHISKKKEATNRYTVEFLLSRAESTHSKKMPVNWKELNDKYPNFCFYGKVKNTPFRCKYVLFEI